MTIIGKLLFSFCHCGPCTYVCRDAKQLSQAMNWKSKIWDQFSKNVVVYKKNECIAGLSKMRQLVLLFFRQMSLISYVNSSARRETLSCQQIVRPSTHALRKTLRLLTCRVYKTYKVWVMKHKKSIHTQND